MNRILAIIALALLLGFASVSPGQIRAPGRSALPSAAGAQQGYTSNKTSEDYMETILSRDTKPLGLKEDVVVRNLLRQPAVKWAIRSHIRHGLD